MEIWNIWNISKSKANTHVPCMSYWATFRLYTCIFGQYRYTWLGAQIRE